MKRFDIAKGVEPTEEEPVSVPIITEWFVFGDREEGEWRSRPVKTHPDEGSARKEAERLAAQHPGVTFKVLACVARYRGTVTVQAQEP